MRKIVVPFFEDGLHWKNFCAFFSYLPRRKNFAPFSAEDCKIRRNLRLLLIAAQTHPAPFCFQDLFDKINYMGRRLNRSNALAAYV